MGNAAVCGLLDLICGWQRVTLIDLTAILTAGVLMFGSRTPVDTTVSFEPSQIGGDVEAYLAESESVISGLRPSGRKEIVWADPATRARTDVAVVFIHGFSASPSELRPFPDIIAKNLGANLFLTRLTIMSGKGRSSDGE
eukprot:gene43338-58702_t